MRFGLILKVDNIEKGDGKPEVLEQGKVHCVNFPAEIVALFMKWVFILKNAKQLCAKVNCSYTIIL